MRVIWKYVCLIQIHEIQIHLGHTREIQNHTTSLILSSSMWSWAFFFALSISFADGCGSERKHQSKHKISTKKYKKKLEWAFSEPTGNKSSRSGLEQNAMTNNSDDLQIHLRRALAGGLTARLLRLPQNQHGFLQRNFGSRQFMIPNRERVIFLSYHRERERKRSITESRETEVRRKKFRSEPEKKDDRVGRFGGSGNGLWNRAELRPRLGAPRSPILCNFLRNRTLSLSAFSIDRKISVCTRDKSGSFPALFFYYYFIPSFW